MWRTRALALLTALAGLAGVALWLAARRPVSLAAVADPFVYNGPAEIQLPVRALDRLGRTVTPSFEAFSSDSSIAQVGATGLRCLRAGDARVAVRASGLSTSFALHCRPMVAFAVPSFTLDLVPGGAPQPLPVEAYDAEGRLIRELRFSAVSGDTSIVAIENGLAVPRGVGKTFITVDVGGRSQSIPAEVTEPVARESVQLVAGEYRSWELPPGRYRATYTGAQATASPLPARWRSVNANCAFDPFVRAALHCVLEEQGHVVLLADRTFDGEVRIDRRRR